MKTQSILLVESDEAAAALIRAGLESRGEYLVDAVTTADEALHRLADTLPDAVLLDTTLPDRPAQEVCRAMRSRARTRSLPCIMLDDPRRGLGIVEAIGFGADDCVFKPVQINELEARLRAVLRRHAAPPADAAPAAFRGAHIAADFAAVTVTVDGAPVALTRRELLMLRALVAECNRTISRDMLSRAWGADARDCRVVDSAMWKLRKKLGAAGAQIETVLGFGYRFNEPQEEERGHAS